MARYTPPRRDLAGQRIGRLVCISDVGRNKRYNRLWRCKCDCGNEVVVASTNLIEGKTRSCGCLQKDSLRRIASTHGLSRRADGLAGQSRLYGIWHGMKRRCANPRRRAFERYGGRGIKVCDEWASDFTAFHAWAMASGYQEHLTLDRKDSDGHYEPNNCRWATYKEQARNLRTNVILSYNGQAMTMAEWAETLGMKLGTLHMRIKQGWSVGKALTEPVKGAKACASR